MRQCVNCMGHVFSLLKRTRGYSVSTETYLRTRNTMWIVSLESWKMHANIATEITREEPGD